MRSGGIYIYIGNIKESNYGSFLGEPVWYKLKESIDELSDNLLFLMDIMDDMMILFNGAMHLHGERNSVI